MNIVNEGTTYIVTVSFLDQDDIPIVPTTAQYRVDDEHSGTAVVNWTNMSPLAASVDVVISSTENAMVDSSEEAEIRCLTVSFTYSGGYMGTSYYRYPLLNLEKYPESATLTLSLSQNVKATETVVRTIV